jgi:hyperosmotically inducible protein
MDVPERRHRLGRGLGLAALGCAIGLWGGAPLRADDSAHLQQRILEQLHKAGVDKSGQIDVSVAGSAVTLNGFVTTVGAQRDALKAAHKVSPNVEDKLRVVPEHERTDAEILKDVQRGILRYPRYTIFDSVSVGVDQGEVRLEGSVLQPYRKDDLEAIVARIPGVRKIDDTLWVQRVSISDAELRRQLANAIYRNSLFDRYAIQPNPPIHIVVDGGRVTLTGWVGSPVEQAALGHIARQSWAFSVDNQVKVDGQSPEDRKPEPTNN